MVTPDSFEHLTSLEKSHVPKDYLRGIQGNNISKIQRKLLFEFITDKTKHSGYSQRTAQLAITYIDEILSVKPVNDLRILDLLAKLCLGFAMSFEEKRQNIAPDIVIRLVRKFPKKEIISTQVFIFHALGFTLDRATASEYLPLLFNLTQMDHELLFWAEGVAEECYKNYLMSLKGALFIAVVSGYVVLEEWGRGQEWVNKLSNLAEVDAQDVISYSSGLKCTRLSVN